MKTANTCQCQICKKILTQRGLSKHVINSQAKGVKKTKLISWELNRFCSHSDFVISGIASKLLNYFKKNYQWTKIFSYADRRWSVGDLYKKLGFDLECSVGPNY